MRKKCSAENISTLEPYEWYHPDAKCIDSYDGWEEDTSFDEYECPHCRVKFKVWIGK